MQGVCDTRFAELRFRQENLTVHQGTEVAEYATAVLLFCAISAFVTYEHDAS